MPSPRPAASPLRRHLFNMVQRLLPRHGLSRLMLAATRWRWPPWKNLQIRWFIRRFGVDMSEAVAASPAAYSDFNEFFTRPLRPGSRPLEGGAETVVAPVDGEVSQTGTIRNDTLIQAKGRDFTATALLGGDTDLGRAFDGGAYATFYLAPPDYHRVHMPCAGRLQRTLHVAGDRFAVNAASAAGIDNLFARNERLVNLFDTAAGTLALVMIGALCVGSLQTAWLVPPQARRKGAPAVHDYGRDNRLLERGEEMGRFNMGSTVILLFPAGAAGWHGDLMPGKRVRVGEAIGHLQH